MSSVPLVSCITATGERPQAIRLCQLWIRRQTYPRIEWIVVDDGKEVDSDTYSVRQPEMIIRPRPLWSGENTLNRNLLEGLAVCRGQYIAFIEDDDWYSREWISYAVHILQSHDAIAIGEGRARYYNLPTRRFLRLTNDSHAGLCQTVITRDIVDDVIGIVRSYGTFPFVDIPLWNQFPKLGSTFLNAYSSHVVGIKGLPGRAGLGMGHRPGPEWGVDTKDGDVLRSWVGDDVEWYKGFLGDGHAC